MTCSCELFIENRLAVFVKVTSLFAGWRCLVLETFCLRAVRDTQDVNFSNRRTRSLRVYFSNSGQQLSQSLYTVSNILMYSMHSNCMRTQFYIVVCAVSVSHISAFKLCRLKHEYGVKGIRVIRFSKS